MKKTTRRKFILRGLGVFVIGGVIAWFKKNSILRWLILKNNNGDLAMSSAPLVGEELCVLTSQQVEGPFFVAAPNRRNVKEDREGKDLNLRLQIVSASDCSPIEGAIVEIWHCDAEGIYSGYPEELAHDIWKTLNLTGIKGDHIEPLNEKRFLRGAQLTDANGIVEFETIFPGWYEPRTPHIHFKVIAGDQDYLTSQFYFEPAFCNRVYLSQEPYLKYGDSPFTPENDVVIGQFEEANGLQLDMIWNSDIPLEASARIGVERNEVG